MEWHHFEYFKVLAEKENMTKAAEKLAVSQSALSRALMKIEEEMQVPLFDRRGRSIQLNKYGEEFLQATTRIIYELHTVKIKMQEMVGLEKGEITLGFLHTIGSSYLSHFMKGFRKQHPFVQIKLVQSNSLQLMELLKKGIIDLCLTSAVSVEEPLQWQPLIREKLYITLPKTHCLSQREQITIKELGEETFILLKEGFALRKITARIFQEAGIKPSVSFEGEEIQTIANFVAADLGIALLPHLKNIALMDLVQIPIADTALNAERIIGICWNRESVQTAVMKQMKQDFITYFQQKMI